MPIIIEIQSKLKEHFTKDDGRFSLFPKLDEVTAINFASDDEVQALRYVSSVDSESLDRNYLKTNRGMDLLTMARRTGWLGAQDLIDAEHGVITKLLLRIAPNKYHADVKYVEMDLTENGNVPIELVPYDAAGTFIGVNDLDLSLAFIEPVDLDQDETERRRGGQLVRTVAANIDGHINTKTGTTAFLTRMLDACDADVSIVGFWPDVLIRPDGFIPKPTTVEA